MASFEGIWVPLVTPFAQGGRPARQAPVTGRKKATSAPGGTGVASSAIGCQGRSAALGAGRAA